MKKTKSIIYIALFITLIFIASLIRLNIFIVPFTLQTMAVMLAACFLGGKRGLFAVLIYIFMGLIGLPVFTKGGGFGYILEPTFGYILAFVPAVVFICLFKEKVKNNYILLVVILFAGGIIILLFGALYAYLLLSLTTGINSLSGFITGYFLAFVPAEIIKALAAALIYNRLHRYMTLNN